MRTAVMIAPYFVPRRRVGSLRPFKFVKHLQSFGWKPVVFTIGNSDQQMTHAEKRALKGVTIHHITPPFDRTTSPPSKVDVQTKHRVWADWADLAAEWFDRQVPMDTWIFLFWSAYSKILKQAGDESPDLIWSTGDPWSGHWLGHKLSKDLNKPWIADFRDPWTLSGLNLRERSWFSSRKDRKLEEKFLSDADKIIFTAKATEELYKNTYSLKPGKTATIYNSFSIPDSGNPGKHHMTWTGDIDDSLLNLIFFGSFRRLSPINPIAEAVAALPAMVRNKVRVHSFGSLRSDDRKTLERLDVSSQFITHKKVVPEQAAEVFSQADILMVSTSSERESIIPAKLWEYMISDKPILSITPNPEIQDILKETGAGIHFHNSNTKEIADSLKRAAERKGKGQPVLNMNRDPNKIKQYSSENNTRKLAQIMDTLAGNEQ
ncbi:MAG: glycosyltransferase [Balneolaceae bacterium]